MSILHKLDQIDIIEEFSYLYHVRKFLLDQIFHSSLPLLMRVNS